MVSATNNRIADKYKVNVELFKRLNEDTNGGRKKASAVDCEKNGIILRDNMVIYELNHIMGQASCEYAVYSLAMRGAL